MKRQPIEWEEIFVNYMYDKGLLYKNVLKIHTIKKALI